MPDEIKLNGTDLSGYVNGWGTSDVGHTWTEQSGDARDFGTLPGLQEASMSVTGTWSADMDTFTRVFAEHCPEQDVIVQQPDGWWQAVKASLARRWRLRWVKVRWREYRTRGVPRFDPETGNITISGTVPVAVSTVTRRGGR